MLSSVLEGERSWDKDFEREKEEKNPSLEAVNLYKVEKGKLKKTLFEKLVAMKAIIMERHLVDLGRILILVEAPKRSLTEKNKKLLSCSSQSCTDSGLITDKLLRNIPPV